MTEPTDPPDDLFDPVPEESPAARKVAEWVKPRTPPRARSRRVTPKQIAKWAGEFQAMLQSGDWQEAKPVHLVYLYAWCHKEVYGVEAADVFDGDSYLKAAALASMNMQREHGGDISAAVEFVRWAWAREEGREKWRRENAQSGSRLHWRFMWGASVATEYRLDQMRQKR